MKISNTNINLGLGVKFQLMVVDGETGAVVSKLPPQRNLILNQGLDQIATRQMNEMTSYAIIGTGTDPINRDSGAITVSKSGTTITASAAYFEAQDAGRIIKFDSGEEFTIDSFTDTTHVEVVESGAVASSECTIWYTNRTALASEVKRSANYLTGAANCGTNLNGTTLELKRTIDFSIEAAPITYNEIGWSWANSGANTTYGIQLISGGLALATGQLARVVVTHEITFAGTTPFANDGQFTGMINDGDGDAQVIGPGIEGVDTFGQNAPVLIGLVNYGYSLDPSYLGTGAGNYANIVVYNTTIGAATFPQNVNSGAGVIASSGIYGILAITTYSAGSYTRTKFTTFQTGDSNSSDIKAVGISDNATDKVVFRHVFDDTQTKTVDQTFRINIVYRWNRVLTN